MKIIVVIVLLIVNVVLGAMSINYVLASTVGRTIPTFYAALAGLFLGEFSIPAAIICWVLRLAGVHAPFFH